MTWQVGDLAVCIFVPDWRGQDPWEPKVGGVYTVVAVAAAWDGEPILEFEEDTNAFDEARGAWDAHWFRKVVRDKHEACEPEFITLLNKVRDPLLPENEHKWLGEEA